MPIQRSKLLSLFKACFVDFPFHRNIYVGYSGGVDSTALLHLCAQMRNHTTTAVFINYRDESWERHCRNFCDSLQVPVFVLQSKCFPKNNKEKAWREERYSFFKQVLSDKNDSSLCTAHHAGDQAETFLLQAMRGSAEGLGGIPRVVLLNNNNNIIRPLLDFKKSDLVNYCLEKNLPWLEDPENEDMHYKRNKIRAFINSTPHQLTNTVVLCQESIVLLKEFVKSICDRVVVDQKLSLQDWSLLDKLKQKHVLHYFLKQVLGIQTSYKQLQQILQGCIKNKSGWVYKVKERVLCISRMFLYHKKHSEEDTKNLVAWISDLNYSCVRIRAPNSQDRTAYLGRHRSNKLKILFQEKGISPLDRKKAVIICHVEDKKKIIAIYPFFLCQ